ncbi:MAG: T9SS type B sorting domain-containing protein, partial [Bacteroidia bacterium]|nr:T9SS type B sorting domain-containing protein [Bacteroidia bacterium]
EWVELYNPNPCASIDISNYVLGNYTGEGSAAVVIPQGTIVPALGFAIVRGSRADPVPTERLVANGGNVVEIEFNGTTATYCMSSPDGDARFWLPDGAGWLAIYDNSLQPQDAIAWGDMASLNSALCNPFSSMGTAPSSFSEISTDQRALMSVPTVEVGMSFRRIPDGDAWRINESSTPTYGNCNGTCVESHISSGPTLGSSTCTGTAKVTVSGGIEPYSYRWDDPLAQTTATATGLCAGTYTVTVTDATNQTNTIEYTIENYIPEVTHQQIDICSTDIPFNLLSLTDKAFPLGGNYAGNNIQDNILTSFDTNIVTATYTYAENGCENTTSFPIHIINLDEITITPDTHICQGESVLLSVDNFPPQATILWEGYDISNPSYVNQTVSPNNTETYSVRVELDQCSTVLETIITINENPMITAFVEDSQLAGAGEIVYTNGTPPYEFFLQDQNQYSPTGYFEGIGIGNHTIQIVDANMCKATFSFYLDIPIIPDLFFTPNGDGVNDVWTIKNINLISHSVYIYDRFSKLLYTAEDNFDGWDGTYQGNPLPNTDYWFLIKIKPINKQLTGHFTLKR